MKSMQPIWQALALALLCALPALAQSDPKMTADERAKLIRWLNESQAETIAAVEKLSDAQWNWKAAPEKWSVAECVEHIMLAESTLMAQAEKALAAPPNPDWAEKTKGKSEFIENVMVKRLGKAQAPEAIVPNGKLPRAELMKRLREARAKTLKFAETTQLPLKAHTAEHPFPVFGTLNAYQWVIYIPLHNIRHNQQIAEVKANPNFPLK
ncbi:MAG: DinB family protein [Acidobacteria bacterium]|nr:DinB family protein [Acidobacteriota bacterium]MBI3421399.1 DinB family protein [Acidobacteriota bacterium]